MATGRAKLNTKKALKKVAKKPARKKPMAKPNLKLVSGQPDDPGPDETFDWVQIKTSWGTTPVWVKSLLVVLALVAVAGFLF